MVKLLSRATVGAIADLGLSGPEVERVLHSVGLKLEIIPPTQHGEIMIVPHISQRLARTLHGLDLTDRTVVNQVLAATNKLAELYAASHGTNSAPLVRLRNSLADDGFSMERAGDPMAAIRTLASMANAVLEDASAIRAELTRLERHLGDDPSRDIGTAKRLVEATAKIVLTRQKRPFGKSPSVPGLVKEVTNIMAGIPDNRPPTVQDTLIHLEGLAIAVNLLRNKVGDGHAGTTAVTGIDDREGRLAVRAAIAWCAYVLDSLGELPVDQPAG